MDKKRKKRVKAKAKAKTKVKGKQAKAKAVNGGDIKPSPREGPRLDVRLRNQSSKAAVAKAAKAAGISVNTFVCDVLDKATGAVVSTVTQASQ